MVILAVPAHGECHVVTQVPPGTYTLPLIPLSDGTVDWLAVHIPIVCFTIGMKLGAKHWLWDWLHSLVYSSFMHTDVVYVEIRNQITDTVRCVNWPSQAPEVRSLIAQWIPVLEATKAKGPEHASDDSTTTPSSPSSSKTSGDLLLAACVQNVPISSSTDGNADMDTDDVWALHSDRDVSTGTTGLHEVQWGPLQAPIVWDQTQDDWWDSEYECITLPETAPEVIIRPATSMH